MKKYFLLFITVALLAGTSCQERIDTEKEKEAIVAVIEGITKAHAAGDWDAWLSLWLNEPYIFISYAAADYHWMVKGRDNLNEMVTENTSEEGAEEAEPELTLEPHDYFIRVFKECAWASYKIKWTSVTDSSDVKEEWETFENYAFEKRDGVWKVATVSAVDITSFEKQGEEGEMMKEEAETEDAE
ncbi:MAG: nuclear transport factor 2 family protein [Bacteroidales bacterium]|nr:nuclear transport factor 2 family protein [Bacteroidales bacterium]